MAINKFCKICCKRVSSQNRTGFCQSCGTKGERNGAWRGESVKYYGLHSFINRNKPRTELCEICNTEKSYDIANISGEYKRDISDYKWLCRKCHMIEDGRLKMLHKIRYWSNNKNLELINLYKIDKNLINISKKLNKSKQAIRTQLTRLRILPEKKRDEWRVSQIYAWIGLNRLFSPEDISIIIEKSLGEIYYRKRLLGIDTTSKEPKNRLFRREYEKR